MPPLVYDHHLFHGQTSAASTPSTDWVFMAGLLGIGLALTLGIGMRIAAATGALMLMWAAALRLENNPFIDDHIVYAIVLVALAVFGAGRTSGLGGRWEKLPLVQRIPLLS